LTEEIWLPVVGFEDRYEVSNMGRVRSLPKLKQPELKILKPSLRVGGYLLVTLRRDTAPHQLRIHCLVLEAFVGPRPEGHEARHLNGKRNDNRLDNLAWGTKLENANDKRVHGTMCIGENHGRAKLTAADVLEIRRLHKAGARQVDLAKQFGIVQSKISSAILGYTWGHI
jgi:hypothetical protein